MSVPTAPARTSLFSSFARRALAPVDIAPLVWFRVLFGLIMLVEVWRYFEHDWIRRYYIAPEHHFTWLGFSWVRPWPGDGMLLHFLAIGALAVLMTLGFFYRVASLLFFLGFTYVFLLEQAHYLNHFYLVCLFAFLLAVVPAHRAGSVDAWRIPGLRSATAPAWTLWLLRLQLSVVYFFGGIAKLNSDWLHGEPMRMWLEQRVDTPVVGHWFTHPAAPYFFSYAGLLFDLGIAPLLWWRRTRWLAFAFAIIFNLTNAQLFNIGIFPWLALGATLILFAPRLPFSKAAAPAPLDHSAPLSRRQRLAVAGFVTYIALQILVPLRHWLYPGDVQWTEEGHRFSWRMKLRNKEGALNIIVTDPDTHVTWPVEPRAYAKSWQLSEAVVRPDMLLQLAHFVAVKQRAEGHPRVEVRIETATSLNGRPEEPLLDPNVDLAAQPRTLFHVPWILPLTTPLDPAHTKSNRNATDAD